MTRVPMVLVIAAILCGGCGAGRESAAPGPTMVQAAQDACQAGSADGLDGVVALAVAGLERTTSGDGWSRACARVPASNASEEPSIVTVQVGWRGTLDEYASLPGMRPLVALGDEAYVLDCGRGIALRSGEIVAVVGHSRGTPSDTEALARRVAEQLPE